MPAGRPTINNQEILDEIKKDPKKLQSLRNAVKELGKTLTIIEASQDTFKSIVEATNEATGLSKGFISKIAKAAHSGSAEEQLSTAEALAEAVEIAEKTAPSVSADAEEF